MRIIFFIFFFAYSFSAEAQIKFGIRAGLNLSNISHHWDDGRNGTGTLMPRVNLGVMVEIPFNENWVLFTGPYYSGKGKGCLPKDSLETHLNYLELPVTVAYKFSEGNKNRFILGGGVYAGYGFNGSISRRGGIPAPMKHLHKKEKNRYKRFDMGFNLTSMYELNQKIGIRLDFSKSVINIYRDVPPRQKNIVFGISVFLYLKAKETNDK